MTEKSKANKEVKCGVIMPIGKILDFDSSYWRDVLLMYKKAGEKAGFSTSLVSEEAKANTIHQQIFTNILDADILIVDVSCGNPNVYFEFGIAISFRKPVIITCNDISTAVKFDTSSLKHEDYPIKLGLSEVDTFIDRLSKKLTSTLEQSKSDKWKPFIEQYAHVTVTPTKPEEIEMSQLESMNSKISSLQNQIIRLSKNEDRHLSNQIADHSNLPLYLKQAAHTIPLEEYLNRFTSEEIEYIITLRNQIRPELRYLVEIVIDSELPDSFTFVMLSKSERVELKTILLKIHMLVHNTSHKEAHSFVADVMDLTIGYAK